MIASTAQFTTRARVVDLLGREQIADAPTAMGELFKNAIDAGASNVRIDYWPEQACLSLGDDGIGMRTNEELLAKWFVLATESKHGQRQADRSWLVFATEQQKQQMPNHPFGKKGIGRLAIALLGGGTLVWTRWGPPEALQRTLLLVPWSWFKHPLLRLDQIEIPILTLDRPATNADALALVDRALEWVNTSEAYNKGVPAEVHDHVLADLTFHFRASLEAPIHFAEGPGTQFIVLRTDEIIANHFAGWIGKRGPFGDDDRSNYYEGPKAYLAFNNPFQAPRLNVSLFCNGVQEKLDRLDYWTRADFDKSDHHIKVSIDEKGFARGSLRIGKDVVGYECQLSTLPLRSRSPGPLEVEIGYMTGRFEDSKLPQEQWSYMDERILRFGGFSVYMENIRVCPYGRDDSDFLAFEKRRSLSAGRYFWSHRRMFGGVFLSADKNASSDNLLQEKAGREGFVQNAAFNGLVHYLKALFIDLADSHFGSKAPDRPDKDKRDRRYAEKERKKAERQERMAGERQRFETSFEASVKELPKRIDAFRNKTAKLATEAEYAKGDMFAVTRCADLLRSVREQYDTLWTGMIGDHPTGFTLESDEIEAVEDYLAKKDEFDLEATRLVTTLATKVAEVQAAAVRLPDSDDITVRDTEKDRQQLRQAATAAANTAIAALDQLANVIRHRPDEDIKALEALERYIVADRDKTDITVLEELRTKQVRHLQEVRLPFYQKVVAEAQLLAKGDSDLIEADDLREELRVLREQQRLLFELAQLGLVMESTDHDYNSMMKRATEALDAIEKSSGKAPAHELQILKITLQHLDAQLQNWDPLVRRVRGYVSEIKGEEIWSFVLNAFDKQRREGLSFEYTTAFWQSTFTEVKRPVFLGAIHNLVMNGGYWALKAGAPAKVKFSTAEGGLVVSDSGHGVHERDATRVFDPGFSRRPLGRGLGLFIASTCLSSFGYKLELLPSPALGALLGANFLITRTVD
jgi:signal transduction histidine kinase